MRPNRLSSVTEWNVLQGQWFPMATSNRGDNVAAVLATSAAMLLVLVGCTTVRSTSPSRSATEELLITQAAERAADNLARSIPGGLKIYFDKEYLTGEDAPYVAATIQDHLLRRGETLVEDKKQAEAVLFPRIGALSTNEFQTMVGSPPLPVPFAWGTGVTTPELNLFKHVEADGIAKFYATVQNTKTGKLIVATDPAYGYSRHSHWILLFLFTWSEDDLGTGAKNPDYSPVPSILP
jgi:hypothetical protein